MTGGLGKARRPGGACGLSHALRCLSGASYWRAPAVALACLLLAILFPVPSIAGDSIDIVHPGSDSAPSGAEAVVGREAELAPDGSAPAPAEPAQVAENGEGEIEAEPAGNSVSVSTKTAVPTSKSLTIPLAEGAMYLEAYDRLEFDRSAGTAILEGDALIVIDDVEIEADYIELNDRAKNVYLRGNIALQQKDDVMFADEGYYSYDTNEFSFINVSGNTSGTEIGGTVYFKADEAKGSMDDFDMWNVWATSCPPHCKIYEYELRARKARVHRDSSLMLHHVYIYVRERKIMFVPELAFPLKRYKPLRQTESPIQQDFGLSPSEGYYAKFAYTYMNEYSEAVGAILLGVALLELTQKQGPGTGIRHDFATPLGVTTLRGFYQRQVEGEKDENTGVVYEPQTNYRYELLQELKLTDRITGDLSINRVNLPTSYRGRNNKMTSKFSLTYKRPKGNISLSGSQNLNITTTLPTVEGGEVTRKQTNYTNANFSFAHRINRRTSLNITQTLVGNKTTAGVPMDLWGDFSGNLTYSRSDYDVSLKYYERGMDFDGDRNTEDTNRSYSKLQPGLTWNIRRSAFGKNTPFTGVTVNLEKIYERRGSEEEPRSTLRFKADTGLGRTFKGKSTTLTTSLGFSQYMYGDGNAQYSLKPSFRFDYDNRDWFSFGTRWSRTVQNGVKNPPVLGDRTRSSHSVSFDMGFYNEQWWKLTFRSGYNFQRKTWTKLSSTWKLYPSPDLDLTFTSGYNIESKTFSSLTTEASYNAPSGNWWLDWRMTTKLQGYSITSRPVPFESYRFTYSRRYKRGWNFYLTGTHSGFKSGKIFDRVEIQKRSTCTTMNMGYSSYRDEYYVSFFINAFPRYPVEVKAREHYEVDVLTPASDWFNVQGLASGLGGTTGGYAGYY